MEASQTLRGRGSENLQANTQSCVRAVETPSPEPATLSPPKLSPPPYFNINRSPHMPTNIYHHEVQPTPGWARTLTCSFEQLNLDEESSCCSDTPFPGQCPPWTSTVSAEEYARGWKTQGDRLLLFFWPHRVACRILVPWPGNEPGPWQWKHRVLTTGLSGNSPESRHLEKL